MAITIRKIKLSNFKRYTEYTIEPNDRINVFVGNNESGKSSIIEAIDIVISGSVRRVESIGIDKLICVNAVKAFIDGDKNFENLPIMRVELFLSDTGDMFFNGKNNSDNETCDGIRLVCAPNPDYRTEINEALFNIDDYFPYDYYSVRFSTFADEGYSGMKRKIHSALIDSTNMNSEYATNDFIRRMYMQYTDSNDKERAIHKSKYRQMRNAYCAKNFTALNERVPSKGRVSFGLKSENAKDFEGNLMIYEDEIAIDNKGTGRQVFIKTEFALNRTGNNADIILIEEPENHLSQVNLRKLIQSILNVQNGQLFITTHNSLISTRLELKNVFLFQTDNSKKPVTLKDLNDETAIYFMKAPPASIVEYALSSKVILVEGPSEYMLLDLFYSTVTGNSPEKDDVHIIDVRGLSFKRYLDISKLLKNKVAVITDNDSDYEKNCIKKYEAYSTEKNISVFFNEDNEQRTFEIVLYKDNTSLCEQLFPSDTQEYMLNNKTEAAFTLISQDQSINVPDYIARAIQWIRE